MILRPVVPADYPALEALTRDAFWDVYKPGCDEHYLVHQLHERNACALELLTADLPHRCLLPPPDVEEALLAVACSRGLIGEDVKKLMPGAAA